MQLPVVPELARRPGILLPAVLLAAAAAAAAAPAQTGGPAPATQGNAVVARYTLDGKSGSVSVDDLALELAARFDHTERGDRAREQLIWIELVRGAATREGVWPDRDAIREYTNKLEQQLRTGGEQLADWLRRRHVTREEFEREFAAPSLAHERLVMKAMGFDRRDKVTPELLQLWLEEARSKAGVVTDADRLPPGVVAKVGERSFTRLDLGRMLLRDGDRDEREKFVRQIVVCRAAEARATALGLEVTAAEAAAEVESRRTAASQDDRLRGLTFEQLLQSQGTTVEELRRSPVLRTQILARKLVAREHSDAALDARLADDGEAIRARHGARRKLGVIFLRAAATPNALVPRTFEVAEKLARTLRESLQDGRFAHRFAHLARTNSDEPATKVRGGDAGWHHRAGSPLPDAVLAAAFALEPGAISEPVRAEDGVWLVRLDGVEPEPPADVLRERLRAELAQQVLEQLLEEAKIEFVSQ